MNNAGRAGVIAVPGNLFEVSRMCSITFLKHLPHCATCNQLWLIYIRLPLKADSGSVLLKGVQLNNTLRVICKEDSPGRTEHSLRKVTWVKLITSSRSGKLRARLGYPSSQGAIDIQLQLSLITDLQGTVWISD